MKYLYGSLSNTLLEPISGKRKHEYISVLVFDFTPPIMCFDIFYYFDHNHGFMLAGMEN